ncbi:ABC transporter permease [Methylocapsa sp. S129]|uniref:ABC transporter permease n=1 Tax=Methylocapsa sp. S129 TaxID=1641869 RepID=UPI00131BE0BC|nr:ABC transporter permease [Methylocapsa sp. S129]
MNEPIQSVRSSLWSRVDLGAVAPFAALAALLLLGTLVSPRFMSVDNLSNVLTRSAFIATIAVGATFVITAGGLDLSVGSMAAFVAGIMILFLNGGLIENPVLLIAFGMILALFVGALCGLANGLTTTLGRIEPFIVTLGTMGIFRSLVTWLAQGGSIVIKSSELRSAYRPVYFGDVFGAPIPIFVILGVAAIGAFILYRTAYGRHVTAVGSNEEVARYSGINVTRVRTITFVLQGLCVAIAVIVYVPRLGSTTSTTGLLWELQAITAVVIGGTRLRGGVGRIWGTIAGALILEVIGNIMVLSDLVSEYLIGAVQGAIIVIAMLAQRSLSRTR